MKVAVSTIAFNEKEVIKACIKQFKPFNLHHQVLISTKPWNGSPREDDGTANLAKNLGAEVICQYWKTEADQRNWALANLYDYDYVLIVDADELYTQKDIRIILRDLNKEPCFRVNKMVTYWKGLDFIFDPPDGHRPIIAVNPKVIKFSEHRQVMPVTDSIPQQWQPFLRATLHHLSWVKSDKKVKEKIESFSHADEIDINWYYNVWKEWTPGSKMCIRPYGREKSIAKFKQAPDEIRQLMV